MNIISFNCRGLDKDPKITKLAHLVREKEPDLVFLSETKSNSTRMENIPRRLNFGGCFVVECVKTAGGLCLLWKEGIEVNIQSYTQHHIDAMVDDWRFTSFYGCSRSHVKKHTLDLMRRIREDVQESWLVIGNFNLLFSSSDKIGGLAPDFSLMERFRGTLHFCQLQELKFEGSRFTWDNGQLGVGLHKNRSIGLLQRQIG